MTPLLLSCDVDESASCGDRARHRRRRNRRGSFGSCEEAAAPPEKGGGLDEGKREEDDDGRVVDLNPFDGRVLVVNVWASWCPGCNEEAVDLARFAARHRDVAVLGLNTEDTDGAARAFYRKWDWHHPSIADRNDAIAAGIGVTGLPTTLFLDIHRHVVGKIVGPGSLAQFEQGLRLARPAR